MTTRGRALRFTAISALVVLSLTGFSTSRHGHGHGGDGGGGCSSSSQDHDSSSSTSGGGAYKDDDTYDDDTYDDTTGSSGGSGSSSSGSLEPATVELVACATESARYATVEITNPNATEYTFAVTVFFKDAADTTIADGREETTVPARGVTEVRVPLDGSATPDHCELDDAEPLPLS